MIINQFVLENIYYHKKVMHKGSLPTLNWLPLRVVFDLYCRLYLNEPVSWDHPSSDLVPLQAVSMDNSMQDHFNSPIEPFLRNVVPGEQLFLQTVNKREASELDLKLGRSAGWPPSVRLRAWT